MTLTEFLLTRIAEKETVAQACAAVEHVHIVESGMDNYVADYDPTCVIRECEALRQIVSLHVAADLSLVAWYGDDWAGPDGLACATCGTANEYAVKWPCETLRAVALPYADRTDFDQAWKL